MPDDRPNRNAASGSEWPYGSWEGAEVEQLIADVKEYWGPQVPTGQEVRVVDPKTGGAKGSKLARFDLIPQDVLWALAEHYGRGAQKYDDRNWEKGYAWGLSVAALQRHLSLFLQGEDRDDDPGLAVDGLPSPLHLTAVLWHAAALLAFQLRGIGTDDRK